MPKGEHFKKPNPRIHQVSFKLNATELAEMKRIVAESGKSLPQFLRDIIFDSEGIEKPVETLVAKERVSVVEKKETAIVEKEEEKIEIPKPLKPVAQKPVEKLKEEKSKHEQKKDNNNQFSLF